MTVNSIVPGIVPFDPTIGIAVVATAVLTLAVAFMMYIAFVMPGWSGSPNAIQPSDGQKAD